MQKNVLRSHGRRGGFTLVELLIVIGIIILLISILVPVVSRVRTAGQNAASQSFLTQLARSIEAYEIDFRAYPGPLTNTEVYNSSPAGSPLFLTLAVDSTVPATDYDISLDPKKITMSENLVLGLLGGLKYNPTTLKMEYDPRLIGGGAYTLNNAPGFINKKTKAYAEETNLTWRMDGTKKTGQFKDDAGSANDSIIPEFGDTYPDPMPILYLRAKRGASVSGPLLPENNTIITYDAADPNHRMGQYDLHQIIAYTGTGIGAGRKQITRLGWAAGTTTPHGLSADAMSPIDIKSALQNYDPPVAGVTYKFPFDAYAYFRNAALSTPKESDGAAYATGTNRNDVPHQKDGFILISAGPDRIYGTRDDITNFGTVGQ